jgi:hypothetical protein
MHVASTCVWHVAMQATYMQAACFELPTRFVICTKLSPCLELSSLSSVVPRFSVLHSFVADFIRMAWTHTRRSGFLLLCINDGAGAYTVTDVRGLAFPSRCTRETRHILLMHYVPLCHRKIE